VKSGNVLPQVRCEHRYTDEHLRSQRGQTKIVQCFRSLVSTGDLTDIQTKLVLCYSALLTIQDLAKGCTGPYLAKSWTGPYLRHRTSLETGLDLPYDTGLRLRRDWTLLTIHDPV